jgi:AcrR family transcriptional regulator
VPERRQHRTYTSVLRAEQAAASRRAILEAAHELFLSKGYGATTIEQVAQRAGVSKPTVFAAVGNKQTLFKTVRDVAMAGDDDPTPIAQRSSLDAARSASTSATALHAVVAHVAALQARYAGVEEVLRGAAASGDPELRDLWALAEQQRKRGAALLLELITAHGSLRRDLDVADAVDVLALYMSPDNYHRLVISSGWSHARYESWLARALTSELLED